MRHLTWCAVALAATACTDGRTPRTAPRTSAPPSRTVRECIHPDRVPDLRAQAWSLALPGAWVKVAAISARPPGNYEATYSGTYVPLGGDPGVAARLAKRPRKARLHSYVASGAATALRQGATVYLHRNREDHYDTGYWLRGRTYGVLGDCAKKRTAAVKALLGRHAPDYLAAFPGKPAAEIRRMLGYLPSADLDRAGQNWRTVGPGNTPPVVLARLRRARFVVETTPSWRGAGVVCGTFALGGSGCVDPRHPAPATLWYDPASPEITFVLRRGTGDPQPGRALRTANVRGGTVTLTLDAERVTVRSY